MKRMKMKFLLKLIQMVEGELDEMKYMSEEGGKAVDTIRRAVVSVRSMMVEYIDV